MKNLLLFFFLFTTLTFFSCKEEISTDASIGYYFETTISEDIEFVNLDFLYARAFQENAIDDKAIIRSVYLEDGEYQINTQEEDNRIHMGTSTIEPSVVEQFSVSFSSDVLIQQNGDTREVKWEYPSSSFKELDLNIVAQEEIEITSELDMEKSKLEFIDGVETFFPIFNTHIKR